MNPPPLRRKAWYRSRGYPENWEAISHWVRFTRAAGRCECRGECGERHGDPGYPPGHHLHRCRARHGSAHPTTGSRVELQTAHLNHVESDCRPRNLRAMCQRCHLRYDRREHDRRKRASKREQLEAAGQTVFDFGVGS